MAGRSGAGDLMVVDGVTADVDESCLEAYPRTPAHGAWGMGHGPWAMPDARLPLKKRFFPWIFRPEELFAGSDNSNTPWAEADGNVPSMAIATHTSLRLRHRSFA